MLATPTMFSAKKLITTPLGMWGAPAASVGSIAADTPTRPTNATNHETACRAPTNNNAPSGAVNPHRHTAEELRKPPRLHCRTNGRTKLIHSWLCRKNMYRRVRANVYMLAADAS